jgi:DNA replication and repair protein RecF
VDVIARDAEWSRLDGNWVGGYRTLKISKKDQQIDRLYEINQKPKKRLSFNDTLPVILFEPEHMRLLTGSPDLRREFFDSIISKTDPEFEAYKRKYKRALAQRNRLLKCDKNTINKQVFVWNVRLSELAGKIVAGRIKLINKISDQLPKTYSQIAQKDSDVSLAYQTDLSIGNYESALLKKLEANIEKDILRGFTAYGPHREDILINMWSTPASVVASRGETRTLVLALKLLELNLIEHTRQQKPLILLDDVFSELDGSRRKAITKYLDDYQTIITTTDADVVQKGFAQSTNRISLS